MNDRSVSTDSAVHLSPSKRPPNAYGLYFIEMRPQVVKNYPMLSNSEIMQEISKRWSLLSNEEKYVYKIRSDQLFSEFKTRNPEYSYKKGDKKSPKKKPNDIPGQSNDSIASINQLFSTNHFFLQQLSQRKDNQ